MGIWSRGLVKTPRATVDDCEILLGTVQCDLWCERFSSTVFARESKGGINNRWLGGDLMSRDPGLICKLPDHFSLNGCGLSQPHIWIREELIAFNLWILTPYSKYPLFLGYHVNLLKTNNVENHGYPSVGFDPRKLQYAFLSVRLRPDCRSVQRTEETSWASAEELES